MPAADPPTAAPAPPRLRALVVGGSLGGLTAAAALGSDPAWDVEVREKSSGELKAGGAGLAVQREMEDYLLAHNIIDSRETASVPTRERVYVGRNGTIIGTTLTDMLFTSWDTLYRKLKYRFGAKVVGFKQRDDGVEVEYTDGTKEECDLLVCADGAKSTLRQSLLPEVVEAEYAGYVAWRGLVEESKVPPELAEFFRERFIVFQGFNQHILAYTIPGSAEGPGQGLLPGSRLFNWVWYVNAPVGEPLNRVMMDAEGNLHKFSVPQGAVNEEAKAAMQKLARESLAPQFAQLVLLTEEPFLQAIYDIAVPRMAFTRVALVGDAAFLLRPHTAAGTSKAASDAIALANMLQRYGRDVPSALREWEKSQLELGKRLVTWGKMVGDRSQFQERHYV
eukprot:jgi/Chlat1/2537/Chrsp175S02434